MELLIIRTEITCLILLVSFAMYYLLCGISNKEQLLFLKLTTFTVAHILFSIITVYTVNNADLVGETVNRICHILFFLTGLLAQIEIFKFSFRAAYPHSNIRKYSKLIYIPALIYLILTLFLPVEYCQGNGTMYSYGTLVFIAYGFSICMSIASLVIFIIRWKWINFEIKYTVVPMCIIMVIFILAQAIIPELLMTAGGLSLVCIGVFFTLDNPISTLKEQAYWDKETRIKNRNCYEKDMAQLESEYKDSDIVMGILMADVNYLKLVNDKYGHHEGDRLLQKTAKYMRECLKYAEDVYRIGGDEFVAIYIDADEDIMQTDIEEFKKACKEEKSLPIPLSIAVGYEKSSLASDSIKDIVRKADEKMYEVKERMHENINI